MPSDDRDAGQDGDAVIRLRNVSKFYGVPPLRWRRAGRRSGQLGPPPAGLDWAIKDIDLTVRAGELLGVIGSNGSGKSTLLKMIARVSPPNSGSVEVHGSIFPMIELMAGMNPVLTGRENVILLAAILGLSKAVKANMAEIEEFCELGARFDQPVETYSSGMPGRLGFAVSAFSGADILLVDEVMATGDLGFRDRSVAKMEELRSGGKTVVLVSHSLGAIASICTRGIVMDSGSIVFDGGAEDAVKFYQVRVTEQRRKGKVQPAEEESADFECAPGFAVHHVEARGPGGKPTDALMADERCGFVVDCDVPDGFEHGLAEIIVQNRTNSAHVVREKRGIHFGKGGKGFRIAVRFPAGLPLRSDPYSFTLRLYRHEEARDGKLIWVRCPVTFTNRRRGRGSVVPDMEARARRIGTGDASPDREEAGAPADRAKTERVTVAVERDEGPALGSRQAQG